MPELIYDAIVEIYRGIPSETLIICACCTQKCSFFHANVLRGFGKAHCSRVTCNNNVMKCMNSFRSQLIWGNKTLFSLHIWYHGCRWPGDAQHQDISKHGFGLITRRVHLYVQCTPQNVHKVSFCCAFSGYITCFYIETKNTKRQENSLGRRREAPMSLANTRAVSLTTLPFLCSELAWHCHINTSHQTSTWLALFCILLWVVMDKLQGPVSILKYRSKYSDSIIMKRPSYIYNGKFGNG